MAATASFTTGKKTKQTFAWPTSMSVSLADRGCFANVCLYSTITTVSLDFAALKKQNDKVQACHLYKNPPSSSNPFIARTFALLFPPTDDFLRLLPPPPTSQELIPEV